MDGIWTIAPKENFHMNNWPLDDCSRTITPKKIDKYAPGNCPQGKLSLG